MANATQIVTLGAAWTKMAASGGRDAIVLLDARGTIEVAIWEGKNMPDVETGHVVSGSGFSRVIKGAEAIWARGAGVQVAVTLLSTALGYTTNNSASASGPVSIPANVPRTQSTPATGTLTTPFLNTAVLRFEATDLPVPIGYLSQVDLRYFGAVMRDFTETATDAQATANLAALQAALDWSYAEGGIPVLSPGRLDIFGTAILRPGVGIRGQGKHHSHIRQRSLARSASETYADVFASDETTRAGFNTILDLCVDGGWNMRDYEGATGDGNWSYDIATKAQKGISIRSKAATETNIGNGAAGGVNASLVYGTGTDMHGLIQNVKIQNTAGYGLYLLGRGEMQIKGVQIERSAVNGLLTACADSFYSNLTVYLSGNSGVVIRGGASDSRWVNTKSWFAGVIKSSEASVGAGYEFPDNGTANVNMRNATSQDTYGPGFFLRGRSGLDIEGACDEAGGGRLPASGPLGWAGTRALPRCFVRSDNTLKRSRIKLNVFGGARLTAADYPYLLDLSGSGNVGNVFEFYGDLHDDAGSSGYTMDLAAGTITGRIKGNGVLWTNGYTNAKRYNEVWFGKRLMHGFVSGATLADTTHGVNDAMYGPTTVIRDDGRIMVRSSGGAWVAQGGA